jgi:hypothetical protein
MAATYPSFQSPGNGLSFVTPAGGGTNVPSFSQISAPLPNGDYLIPGLLNGSEVVLMAYTSEGQFDSSFNNGRGFISAPSGAKFSTSKAPVFAVRDTGDFFVSGLTVTGNPAVLTYWASGGLGGDIFSNTNISYVEFPSGVSIAGIGDTWPTSVAVKSGTKSDLYGIQWDADAQLFKLNASLGSSGKITAPAGYSFTGNGAIFAPSGSSTLAAFLAATDSAGKSVLLFFDAQHSDCIPRSSDCTNRI